ncbi:Methionine-R-sulfoxide reductase [Candidatus Filomicrobium marinum]|uniref:peptide-methionine (R)-S-oxide reductase n=2 Tax=Filomicrobium TaxID=119044 RepID=A0A0D6JGN9_9HYPH|nr:MULTISPECIES: peptide-methionine (R)-S-oxide reductase MsrB [Filomicrobium]MCV0369749.1 peptide-methionine (R)-S-oxide reductase MsrB [Filomicrobium sp.]CFX49506.1 Methionine-R-sulfoxide reductase [Candidatus Filomicrobium marinum]CPR20328.1 Methionine-R-sulfoxide reductase [Candidatus Filomicrobium marinum]SDP13429.1 peptide-methionine (R)-S-oxide reductase [Filomicrobium insigne]
MLSRRTFSIAGLSTVTAAVFTLASNREGAAENSMTTTFPITKTPEEWRAQLTPEQFRVLRQHGTERARSHPFDKNYDAGTYLCAGCDQPVFSSDTKFDSRTGWPSFWKPIEGAIGTSTDHKFFMVRTEVHCSRCGGHLGHVFDDGPEPTGLRYCMNGVAMKFVPEGGEKP